MEVRRGLGQGFGFGLGCLLVPVAIAILVVGALSNTAQHPYTEVANIVGYSFFTSHLSTSQAQGQDDFNAVADAYSAGGLRAAEAPASFYLGWSTVELAWLDANPSQPCYAALQADWKATIVSYRRAMNAILAHNESAALSWIEAGTASMHRATVDLDTTDC